MTTPTGWAPPPPPPAALPVTTPSGQTIAVMGPGEVAFYEGQRDAYQAQNQFTLASDLLDLDRLLFMELLINRATNWLGSGVTYTGDPLTPAEITAAHRALKENSAIISTIKNDLKMTKTQRDKAQYESVGSYVTELKVRAKEHGIKREKELGKAIALINELFAVVGAYDRSDEVERHKLGFESAEDIVEWVRATMKPEFRAIDDHFRTHQQSYWVRKI